MTLLAIVLLLLRAGLADSRARLDRLEERAMGDGLIEA
jgi:hypothetical protein